ncbi:hypothetical protein DH2020_026764 [Rehmannia glutinosa]|uniref:Pectin acetylesterase n=1 Tax=Rehmannia glutinosa TaxID=99300 RepID=A0ABR0W0F4_REHGL
MVGLTLVHGAAAKGAVCLDGSLPGYHFDRGFGSGANSWLNQLRADENHSAVFMLHAAYVVLWEISNQTCVLWLKLKQHSKFHYGGGWCNNIRTCVYRKKTRRGSSNYFEKQIPFTGILSNKPGENPDFYNWNRVKIRYCDGASFAGDGEDKALLSGCSAGGLATILHCDEFRELFPRSTKVKCLSDAGLFLDATDVSGGRELRNFYGGVVSLQCFFPQNLISNIKTPLFILNAAYDAWQVQQSLALPSVDPRGDWRFCRKNIDRCSPSQIQFLQGGFRNHMVNAVKGLEASRQSGLFINSCFAHCQSERQDTWFANNSPVIGKKAIATAVGDWYFDRANIKEIDCPYPCDKTCHNLVFR